MNVANDGGRPRDERATAAADLERVVCRAIRADDAERLRRLFWRCSGETIYRRFFTPVLSPRDTDLRYLTDVDGWRRFAVVALVGGEVVAVARWDRRRDDPTRAEVAVLVEDRWQRRGVARWLLTRLAREAADRGITRFEASVLGGNEAPVRLARALTPLVETSWAAGEVLLGIPLGAAATAAPAAVRGRARSA